MILAPATFDTILIWVAAVCTLAIYSLLYRENPIYRFFEYLFLGLGAAYGFLRLYQDNMIPKWYLPVFEQGQWWWMIPFLIGLLYFTIYFPKLSWMARSLIATLMGLVAGFQFQQVAIQYFPQLTDSMRPLLPASVQAHALRDGIVFTDAQAWTEAANNIVFFVTLVAVMTYFFFSFEHRHKGVVSTAKLGRWLLMISFGTTFGATITARVALAVSRIMFLVYEWLGPYVGLTS
jgi:hypothetical protein